MNPRIYKTGFEVNAVTFINENLTELLVAYYLGQDKSSSDIFCVRYSDIALSSLSSHQLEIGLLNTGSNLSSKTELNCIVLSEQTIISYYWISSKFVEDNDLNKLSSKLKDLTFNAENFYFLSSAGVPRVIWLKSEEVLSAYDKDKLDVGILAGNINTIKINIDLNLGEKETGPSYREAVENLARKELIRLISTSEMSLSVEYPGLDNSVVESSPGVFIKDGDFFIGTISGLRLRWNPNTGGITSFNLSGIKSFKDLMTLASTSIELIKNIPELAPFTESLKTPGEFLDWRKFLYIDVYGLLKKYTKETIPADMDAAIQKYFNGELFYNLNYVLNYSTETQTTFPYDPRYFSSNMTIKYNNKQLLPTEFFIICETLFWKNDKNIFEQNDNLKALTTRELVSFSRFDEMAFATINRSTNVLYDFGEYLNREQSGCVLTPAQITNSSYEAILKYILPAKSFLDLDQNILEKLPLDFTADASIDPNILTNIYENIINSVDFKALLFSTEELDNTNNSATITYEQLVNSDLSAGFKVQQLIKLINEIRGLKPFYRDWWTNGALKKINKFAYADDNIKEFGYGNNSVNY